MKRQHGFTLVEIMMSMVIMGLLMTGVLAFYIQVLKGSYVATQRSILSGDIRKFSDAMIQHASRANECILYLSSIEADRDDASAAHTDRQVILTDVDPIQHPSGNFVVFVYYEIPKPAAQAKHRIKHIRGYFCIPAGNGIGPIRSIDIDLSAAPSTDEVETILTNNWSGPAAKFTDFLLNVRGLAPSETIPSGPNAGPRLFYMNDARAITVSGQIFQSNASILTKDWKTSTESFNFVVTPRS